MPILQIIDMMRNEIIRRLGILLVLSLLTLGAAAQGEHPFNPQKFEAEMEQYITTYAGLTPSEASVYFPLFREMQKKQRILFHKMRQYQHIDTSDDGVCYNAIQRQDEIDIEIKKIQQRYHQQMLKVLPAGKVMLTIKAESNFHRQAFMKAVDKKKHGHRKKK